MGDSFQPVVWKSECTYTVPPQGPKGTFSRDVPYGTVTVTEETRTKAAASLSESCLELAREKYMDGTLDIGQWFPKKKVGPNNVNPEKVKASVPEIEALVKN